MSKLHRSGIICEIARGHLRKEKYLAWNTTSHPKYPEAKPRGIWGDEWYFSKITRGLCPRDILTISNEEDRYRSSCPKYPKGRWRPLAAPARGVFGATRAVSVLRVLYRPNTSSFSNVRVWFNINSTIVLFGSIIYLHLLKINMFKFLFYFKNLQNST